MKVIKYFILFFSLLCVVIWLGIKDSFTPIQRTEIAHPIYTIGDIQYQKALESGKNVVKFGCMFWSIYPGGLAFRTIDEAIEFSQNNKKFLKKFSTGWAVYKLSGDFTLDTYLVDTQRYINKSLLVTKLVKKP